MIRLLAGDCRDVLATLPAESVQCVVTSPPYYGLRDYGTALWDGGDAACDHAFRPDAGATSQRVGRSYQQGHPHRECRCGAVRVDRQIGLEATPEEYLATMVGVFREVRRVLRRDGTCWVNMGDSYNANQGSGFNGNAGKPTASPKAYTGLAAKQLLLMPARLALALQADGWWVRSDIIWHKPNPMPESCTDRPTSAHEHVFLLTKSGKPTFWTHRDGLPGSTTAPPPDYRWVHKTTREERDTDPGDPETWRRINLWRGHDYFYDADAVRESNSNPDLPECVKDWRERPGNGEWPSGTGGRMGSVQSGRNLRNVWTIATHAFSGWTDLVDLVPVPASEVPELDASASATGGDIARITSPDCSLHAGQPDRVPKGFYDGLSAEQLRRIRDTGDRPAQDTPPGSSTTQRIPVRSNSRPSMRDCSGLEDAASATPHSIESHRTDLGSLFSERAISCAEIAGDRPHTQPSPCSPASTSRDTDESSSEADSSLSHCEPGTAADSARTSASGGSCACRCGYYRKVTTKTSHFATFPPELAERCIKAGTSERGCCAACGKPWQRIVEKSGGTTGKAWNNHEEDLHRGHRGGDNGTNAAAAGWKDYRVEMLGWSPGCQHDAPTVPCVVLDPFIGAGTTALVADRLQRDAIGIDLNTQYTRMAMDRCIADAPLFTSFPPAEPPEEERMADLFTDMAAD